MTGKTSLAKALAKMIGKPPICLVGIPSTQWVDLMRDSVLIVDDEVLKSQVVSDFVAAIYRKEPFRYLHSNDIFQVTNKVPIIVCSSTDGLRLRSDVGQNAEGVALGKFEFTTFLPSDVAVAWWVSELTELDQKQC